MFPCYNFYTQTGEWLKCLEQHQPDSKAFIASQHPKFGSESHENPSVASGYSDVPSTRVKLPRSKKYLDWAKKQMSKMSAVGVWNEIDYNIRSATTVLRKILSKGREYNLEVWAAGGYVSHVLDPIQYEDRMTKARRLCVYYERPKDIDLYIVGDAPVERKIEAIKSIMMNIDSQAIAYYARSQFAITAILTEHGRKAMEVSAIQFITVKASSIKDVLDWFDIDCCAIAFNGHSVVAASRCIEAMYTRENQYRESLISAPYAARLAKYMSRGFDYVVPSRYSTTKAMNPKDANLSSPCMMSVVAHGAQFWGCEGLISIYSDQIGMFERFSGYGPQMWEVYINSRDRATRPCVVSCKLEDVINGECEITGGLMCMARMSKKHEKVTDEKPSSEDKFPDIPMSRLPPLDFSITPEAMILETQNSLNKDWWPVLEGDGDVKKD
jgi:hypothetical protein